MTIRAISVYLDLSETMIDKTVKSLIAADLVSKTKINRHNLYKVNLKAVIDQPDMQHITEIIKTISETQNLNSEVAERDPW
jgi:predicted transcriptional regulator